MIKCSSGILFKISKIEFLRQLQNGSVYMNRLDFYTKKENQTNGDGFLDREEGLVCKEVDITFESNGQKIVFENASACMGMATPVFCCSRLRIPDMTDGTRKEINIDPRLIDDFTNGNAAEYGVLFMSKEGFLQRVKDAVEKQNLIYFMGTVRYKDFENSPENINDFPKAIFRKNPQYSYQNEYRIALRKAVIESFRLEIGDISDISYLGNLEMLRHPIYAEIKEECDS